MNLLAILLRAITPTILGIMLLACFASVSQADFTDQGASLLGLNVNARSASLADIDNDSDLDIFFQGGTGARKIYRNGLVGGAGFGFTDASSLLPSGLGNSWSTAWGDINGDGLIDAFVGQSNLGATGDVLINTGPAGFTNGSASLGLDDPGFHQNVAWSDIDNDNDLDLILAMEGPERHEIYLQGAGGSFSPVGALVGFQDDPGIKAYGMAIGDSDGDGDMDIYISTCRGDNNIRNHFYENRLVETGTLSFVDIADSNGTQFMQNSYGTEFHDFDDDGDLDLFMVGADSQQSKIFRNDGGNQFTDVDLLTSQPLLSDVSGDLNGGRAVDYDNDGDLDLFFHDHKPHNGKDAARKLYRNDGNWQFTDVTAAEGLSEANLGSYDSPWGDLDRDGDQDLIATTDSGTLERIFISDESTSGNHWLYLELEGPTSNTSGVGSTLYATVNAGTPDEVTYRREANTNAGTFNQSDLPVHFGLGDATMVDELQIIWTDGTVQSFSDVAVDQYMTIEYVAPIAGDYNGDGVVDAADYTVWRDSFGSASNLVADGDGNGIVGQPDYLIWRDNFGQGAQAASSNLVPEPSTMLLLLLTCLALRNPRLLTM